MPLSSIEPQLLDAVRRGDADGFDALALEVFAYQYAHNSPYRNFCTRRRATPARIGHWRQIPAVPTSAFKVADLTCRSGQPGTLFLTSGTTQGRNRRGRHLVADLALSQLAIMSNAQTHLFPDRPLSDGRRLLILSLTPPPSERPHSSLIHMIDLLMREWGTAESRYLGASGGLDGEALRQLLLTVAEGEPVALFGTTAAFAQWFEECHARGWRVTLPPGSRLMDTGGRKPTEEAGLPLSPAACNAIDQHDVFLSSAERLLGLSAHAVVNEYGMTELSSQFYGSSYVGAPASTSTSPQRSASGSAMPPHPEPTLLYTAPPWVRVRVIDPATGDDMPPGETGVLCHYDLANLHSVMAVHTDDLGMRPPGGADVFSLLGRAAGSEPRGCSLDPSAVLLVPR